MTIRQSSCPSLLNTQKPSIVRQAAIDGPKSVQEAVKVALKRCSLDREQVAEEMSRLLGEKISGSHLNNWAAESKNGWRLPLAYAGAFSAVTNDNSVIKMAFSGTGINVLSDAEMTYFEIGKAVEEKRESDARLKENRDRLRRLRLKGGI